MTSSRFPEKHKKLMHGNPITWDVKKGSLKSPKKPLEVIFEIITKKLTSFFSSIKKK